MKKRTVKILVFSFLTVIISGFLTLILLIASISPVVIRYTVINNTNETFYITPLMEFGVNSDSMEEAWKDEAKMKEYIKKNNHFSVLSRYLFRGRPTIPSLIVKDIELKSNSEVVLLIDNEELKQENGPQILLIKDKRNKYFYMEAEYGGSNTIFEKNSLNKAYKNLIKAKERSHNSAILWFMLLFTTAIILLFPYLLLKNVILFKEERKARRQLSLNIVRNKKLVSQLSSDNC